jgi:D-glycero-alpha-D-manno-heptose-7-phosphate kinase
MGGTLDIRTFYFPLQHLSPCTVNIALDLRTTVTIEPYRRGRVKVSSTGFRGAEFACDAAPFDHPLGLMFAVAAFFRAEAVHIRIDSQSPPRSALGGSSAAAVALVAALAALRRRTDPGPGPDGRSIALTAQAVEESVAGVPCGNQDQLAAVFGGANTWHWVALPPAAVFRRRTAVPARRLRELERHMLVAYCGIPHESRDVNGRWVRQFIAGRNRGRWAEIVFWTRRFAEALAAGDYGQAAVCMNRETGLRRRMTPDVLDDVGRALVDAARRCGCGARFTGAGGGGCVWAIGPGEAVARLRPRWQAVVAGRRSARLLDATVAREGLRTGA